MKWLGHAFIATIACGLLSVGLYCGNARAEVAPSVDAGSVEEAGSEVSEYRVKLQNQDSRLTMGLFGQISQFSRGSKSFQGYTLEGLADYAIYDRIAAQVSIAQSLDMSNGLTVLFTGLRLGPAYSFFGKFTKRSSVLKVNGDETLSVTPAENSNLVVDFGIDQIMFNGVDRIVPATGVSLGLRYDRVVWGSKLSGLLRYGSMILSRDQVQLITAGVGLLVNF